MESRQNRMYTSAGKMLAAIFMILLLEIPGGAAYTRSDYYEGCYKYPDNHTFPYQPPNTATYTRIDNCRTDCTDYMYSALWYGKICTCLDSIDTEQASSDGLCSTACDGDANEKCGNVPANPTAEGYMSIHRSRINNEKNPTNITVLNVNTGSTDPWNQTVWGEVEATVNTGYDEVMTPEIVVVVSDGTERPVDVASYDSNSGAHTFTMFRPDHQYELVSTLTHTDASSVTSSLVVQTNARMNAINVTCPSFVASNDEFECTITAAGNKMEVSLDFGDGQNPRSLDLGDNIIYTIGDTDDYDLDLQRSIHGNYLYFLPDHMVKHVGYLLGFKFNALEVNVAVIFQVWRPVCSTAGEVYCHHTLSCENENSTCNGLISTLTSQCASGHVWSFSQRQCVDVNGADMNTNQLTVADLGASHYTKIQESVITVTKTGWQSHHVDDMFELIPGDTFAIVQPSNCIAYVSNDKGAKSYRMSSIPAELVPGGDALTFNWLFEAYIARPVEVVVKKTYPDAVDSATVTVTMTSSEDVGTTLSDTSFVDVQVKISELEIDTAYSGTTNYTHFYNIPAHPGELPYYTIRWGDGTEKLQTFSSDVNHTYTEAGVYNVTTLATNAISEDFATTTVAIQDEILNLTLDKDYFVTALDNQSTLYIDIIQGTNVTYTITVYDMSGNEFILFHDDNNTHVPGEHNGYSAYLNYTFQEPGNWTMHVVAENCISRLEASLWFKVEIPIIGLDIIDIDPVAWGNSTLVYFSIINGTDISFYSNFDNQPTREWVMHEAGIIGHQYNDVNVLKVTLIYTLMRDWIHNGRVGPVPVTVEEAADHGLEDLVAELHALGQSSLEMLAGPMNPVDLDRLNLLTTAAPAVNSSANITAVTADPQAAYELELLTQLHDSAISQQEQAQIRCARDLDGCSWHHGMAFITPEDYNFTTGPHVLELFAENTVQEAFVNVSTTIWIEYIIEDLQLLANETFVKPGDEVLFNMTVSQLSRANTTIYYDDGHFDEEYRYEMLENDSIEFMHVWNASGNYSVYVESINNVSVNFDTVNMTVQDPVAAMYMRTNSPVTRPWERGGWLDIEIYWAPNEALLATDPFIWIDWNLPVDPYTDEYLGFDTWLHNVTIAPNNTMEEEHDWLMGLADSDVIKIEEVWTNNSNTLYNITGYLSLSQRDYWDFGDYNITINISNLVSYKLWNTIVVVDQDVLDLEIDVTDQIYDVTFGDVVEFGTTMRWGSRVNLTWSYGDQTSDEWTAYDPDNPNLITHQFNEVGVFWTTVTALNSVGEVKDAIPIPVIVQHPITGFWFNCTHEQILLEHPEWSTYVESSLWVSKDVPFATNVTVVFHMDVGNSTNVTHELNDLWDTRNPQLDTSDYYHVHTIGYDYTYGGVREMKAEMKNLISDGDYGDTLDIYEDIYNMTLSVRSVVVEDEAQYENLRLDGYGDDANKFPLDHYIVVEVVKIRGSFVHYNWTFDDGQYAHVYDEDYVAHKYADVGWYTVSVYAKNELSEASYELTFQMQRGVGPVSLYTISPLTRNISFDMTIDPAWIGTDACYYIDFDERGDDLPENPVYILGDEAFCARTFFAEIAENPDYRYDYDFNQTGLTHLVDRYGEGGANFSLSYTYMAVGVYTASITAANEVSREEFSLTVGVTRGPCQWPIVTLQALYPCLVENLCTDWDGIPVRQHYRSVQLSISASAFINCSSTKVYHHTWTIAEVDRVTGEDIRYLEEDDVIDMLGNPTPLYKAGALTTLILAKNTLTYGLYRFSLNISMDGEIGIEHEDTAYIDIVKTPLKVSVVGGVSRRKGWGTNITFDALTESYDPDYPLDKSGFTCTWLCKRSGETWPVYDPNWDEVIPFQVTNASAYYYPGDSGGCFADGYNSSGLFDIHPAMIEDAGGCVFVQDFITAYENEKIELKVVINRDTRTKNYTTFVDITEGEPPQVDISSQTESFKSCLANCKDKVNYASKYTVQAIVTNGRKGTFYEWEWDLYELDVLTDSPNPFDAHQFGHPLETRERHLIHNCDEFLGLTDDQVETFRVSHGRYIDFCKAASTGVKRQAITIEPGLFTALDAERVYFLHIIVRRPNSNNYGETFRPFFINKPPIAGECLVDPPNGTALVTKFSVHCPVAFEDEHKPFIYEITTAGATPRNNDPATIGKWNYFHKGDSPTSQEGGILSSGEAKYDQMLWLRVRVFDNIGSWTDIFINATVDPPPDELVLAQAFALMDGSSDGLFANPTTANQLCAVLAKSIDKMQPNCTVCEQKSFENYTSPDDPEFAETMYLECLDALDICVEDFNETKKSIKEACSTNLAKMDTKTADQGAQLVSTFDVTASNPDDLTPDSVDAMNDGLKNVVDNLENAEDLDPNDMANMAAGTLAVTGNSMTATADQEAADMEEEENMDADTETGTGTRRRRKRRARRRRKRSSGRSAADTQANMLNTVGRVGNLLGGAKAAGESPSKFETPAMNMAVSKSWGDSASDVPADDGNGFNLPSSDNLFPDANDTSQLVMSSQVLSQPNNPFVGKNATDNNTLTINSAVVMLSLTNETGANIDLGNMTEPTHIFIKREAAKVEVSSVVQKAGEYLNDDDKSPFVIHKIMLPAASSLHVRITQTWIFNVTNCTGLNYTVADNETLAYCNWTSTLDQTPTPTWLDVTTTHRPTTVQSTFFSTTLNDATTTTTGSYTSSSRGSTTTAYGTTTDDHDHEDHNTTTGTTKLTTPFNMATTPSWIVEDTNKTGWVLLVGINEKPSLARPESYMTCDLPHLNDPLKLMQRDIKLNNLNKYNYTDNEALNSTGVPSWLWNLPQNLERDLDTCFWSNSFFDSAVESEIFIGVKYIAPTNATDNMTDWLSTTTPAPVRRRRAATTTPMPETTTVGEFIEEMVESVFYQMEFYTAQCKIWNHFIEDWETSGCEVGPYSSPTNTHCICTKLTRDPPEDWVEPDPNIDPISGEVIPPSAAPPMSFGAAFKVPTNEIDMTGAAFANLGENPLVFSVMVSMMCLYMCLCIWARSADIKDEIKASTAPLLDNDPRDKYYYELIVYTGGHSGSGTSAKVSMIFSGDEDETPPRLLFDDKKTVLARGAIDSFIMAVPRNLGSLNMIRVWHDNSGPSPAWNFSRMQVTDLQNNEKFFFVLDRWLAVDQDDGCVDRVIPVAGKDELTNFNLIFWSKAKKDINDGHIWFSVFGRPARSRFTRIQRLTCCLSLLFCTMYSNIWFYDTDDTGAPSPGITIGPISLTVQQLLTGIYASLVAFPVNLLVVMVFRYCGEMPKRLPKAVKAVKKAEQEALTQSTMELRQQADFLNTGDTDDLRLTNLSTTAVDDWQQLDPAGNKKKVKKKFLLPWWFIFVGYLLCLGSVGWCFYAVVSIAFGFGPEKAKEWLISFTMSFFESVFFTQPIKVLGLAAFYALVIKAPAVEDEDERDPELQKDQVYVHQHKRGKDMNDPNFKKKLKNYARIPLPPSEEYLRAARALKLKEDKMMTILREMFVYVIFIYLLCMVGYGNRDPWAGHYYSNVENMLARGQWAYGTNGLDIENVKDYKSFYSWLENTLIASYYSTPVYDGERHWWTTNFTADYNSMPVGIPRLRQLRTSTFQCGMPVYKYEKSCSDSYTIGTQDEGWYQEGWVPINKDSPTALEDRDYGFYYNTTSDLNGFLTAGANAMYSGGGFVYDLSHIQSKAVEKVQYLKDIEWIDVNTRAVFVEFNLYNSAVNLFAVSYILFEFLETGAISPYFKLSIFRLDRYVGSAALTTMVAEILTTFFFIFYMVREIKAYRKVGRKKYFESAWNLFEFVVLIGCFSSLILYVVRLVIGLKTMKRFRDDRYAFHNFQNAAGIDEIYGFCISFVLFAATIKFLKLLRFNKKIMTLAISMVAILKPLASFGLAIGVTFMAFSHMSFMIFVNNLLEFSTFIRSSMTLFSMLLNKFDYPRLRAANPTFAPIMFLAFVVVMTFMLLNFMLTIILDTYMEVKEELMAQENEYQIVEFVTGRLKGLIGQAPPPNLPKMRSENTGFIDDRDEELSSRVDELMDKFMDIVVADPQQKELSDAVDQRKKFLKEGLSHRKIVVG